MPMDEPVLLTSTSLTSGSPNMQAASREQKFGSALSQRLANEYTIAVLPFFLLYHSLTIAIDLAPLSRDLSCDVLPSSRLVESITLSRDSDTSQIAHCHCSLPHYTITLHSIIMLTPRATQAVRSIARSSVQTRHIHNTTSRAAFAESPRSKQASGATHNHRSTVTYQRQQASSLGRQFNTSSSLQASRDASTIDFFYFPAVQHEEDANADLIRVPIMPDNYDPPRTGAHAPEAEFVVHKPEINTMSLDSVYMPMAENHDGHGMGVDFHAVADRIASNLNKMKVPVEEQASMMKQLWSDMVDDVLGLRKKMAA
ncbi:hypothetical protein MRB53_039763 [Persea americana]|nr:hypothetical protein MRB53_039763 [Persea americana]